jgi:hypothetical protein
MAMLYIIIGVLAIITAILWPEGAFKFWIGAVVLLFVIWGLDILVRG